jgi:hypothetical protein
VREVIRGKFPFNKLIDKIIEVKERYGNAASLVIEDSSISYGLIQALREKHINVVDYKPKSDKEERLISQIDLSWAVRCFCLRKLRGSKRLSPNCYRFPVGMTIRSTRWRKVSPGDARRGRHPLQEGRPDWEVEPLSSWSSKSEICKALN